MATNGTTDRIAFPVLVGDIGGTNARFALVPDPASPLQALSSVATGDYPTIEAAVEASVLAGSALRPRSAIIDLAAPITGDAVPLTNAAWVIRPRDMIAALGVQDVILLNDFEALAMALTALDPDDVEPIGGGTQAGSGAKVVVGPGTGLGVGALIEAGGLFIPVPGEGGHVALGPAEADEFPVWETIEPEMGRISAEAILAGRGIVRLYGAVARAGGRPAPLATPSAVTEAALANTDPDSVRTLELYVRLLGRLAGDLALIFMARGGVYIGGGIPPRILPFMRAGGFRRAFEAKAPHEGVVAAMPTFVIVSANPALKGLAAFARAPQRFGVNLAGRRWRTSPEGIAS